MKAKNILIGMLACMSALAACDPIEDESLRDDYQNAGTPITKEELQAAISVTQPDPNDDRIVHLQNSRPDVGGVWHAEWTTGEKIVGSENTTLVYEMNGTFDIWYVGLSANQIVTTDPITITVTDVYDEWDGLLTGAVDNQDKTASKTWTFREVMNTATTHEYEICWMGPHGAWRDGVAPENTNAYWAAHSLDEIGPQTMVFAYDGNTLTTYDADGNQLNAGTFGYTHGEAEGGELGTLITTCPLIGSQFDDGDPQGDNNVFWILDISEDRLTLYKPMIYSGAAPWDDSGWYVFYEPVAE